MYGERMRYGPVVVFIALLMVFGPGLLMPSSRGQSSSRMEVDPFLDGTIGASEYESSKNIDDGKFELFWTTSGTDIYIGMRAKVTGWLSLGLDPANNMTNADMLFGWVTGGTTYVKDAFCTNEMIGCGASGAIDMDDLAQVLTDPDVDRALCAAPITYGHDDRAADGVVIIIDIGGRRITVGGPCHSAWDGCLDLPPGVAAAVEVLDRLTDQQLAAAPCPPP